jgi:diadenosine tetraphosphate (Ap4A) HIT family hydrolase
MAKQPVQDTFHLHLHVYPRWQLVSPHRIDLTAGFDRSARRAFAEAIENAFDGD